MSLINNMLKDLEKRETEPHHAPLVSLTNPKPTRQRFWHSQAFIMASFFILAVVILTTITMLYLHKKTGLIPPQNTSAPQATIDVISQPADTAWLKPTSITGVTLQVKDNITEITFLLNHPALYRIDSDEMQNQLSIHIERAELQAELPPVSYLNTAIEQINMQNTNGETTFTLTLKPGFSIKLANLNDTNANAELVIAIQNQSNTNMLLPIANSTIKTPVGQDLMTQQYQTALLDAESGHYQTAIQHLTSLLKIDPNFKDARTSLVALLLDQGNGPKAKKIIDEGLNEDHSYVPFIELKARIFATEGNPKQALQLLQTASPRMDENPDYHAFLAAMYEQNHNYSSAATLYRQLLSLNANNANWWFGLGVSLDKLNKKTDAITAYTKATAEGHLAPESLAYLQNRLQALQENIDDTE